MPAGKPWSESEIDLLRAEFPNYTNKGLAKLLKRPFGSIRTKIKKLGLSKDKRFDWTKERIKTLKDMYPNNETSQIAKELKCPIYSVSGKAYQLGLRKSPEHIKNTLGKHCRHLHESGKSHRFQQGNAPWNKGKSMPTVGRMAETQFKKGNRPATAGNVGDVAEIKGGYLKIKIAEPNKWKLLNRHNWEKAHGPVPKGFALKYKDGDRRNCQIENLELISHKDLMAENTLHNYPEEIVKTLQTQGLLTRAIKRLEKHAAK